MNIKRRESFWSGESLFSFEQTRLSLSNVPWLRVVVPTFSISNIVLLMYNWNISQTYFIRVAYTLIRNFSDFVFGVIMFWIFFFQIQISILCMRSSSEGVLKHRMRAINSSEMFSTCNLWYKIPFCESYTFSWSLIP